MTKLMRLRNQFLQVILWLAGYIITRSKARPPIGYLELIRHSGVVNVKDPKVDYEAVKKWEHADKLWIEGKYLESVGCRTSILSELYKSNGVLEEGYAPPGLSLGFVGPLGHQAMLCTHIAAQEIGIIKPRISMLPIYEEQTKRPLILAVEKNLNFLQYAQGASISELPNNWHIFERLQLIRTTDGFLDLYQLIEKVFQHVNVIPEYPLVHLPIDYEDFAQRELESLGLPRDAWFATIHIRNTGKSQARRNQPIATYFAAVKEVIASGGWVIRIGDSSMEKFPEFPNFIDLATSQQNLSYLHPYVLAQGKFFIGTSSGPASVPPLFGVPTLITNVTSIGRNMLSSSANSIYIPKKTLNGKKRVLSYSEVLKSSDGFGELELREMQEQDLFLECNSEEEILLGVRELMSRISGSHKVDDKTLRTVAEIRTAFPYASKGTVAQSFIDKNIDWLN